MANCQMVLHVIKRGDTLYRLAQQYRTTVPLILLANPGVNPYNLQIGSQIKICAGDRYEEEPSMDEMQMTADMNRVLMQYLSWLKLYMTSLFQNPAKQNEISERFGMVPDSIANIYDVFYPVSVTNRMRQLMMDYTSNMMDYAKAVSEDQMQTADSAQSAIDSDAEQLAQLLADNNSNYDKDTMEEWLMAPTTNVRSAVMDDLGENYDQLMDTYDNMDQQTAKMADYMADGLIRKFYKEG